MRVEWENKIRKNKIELKRGKRTRSATEIGKRQLYKEEEIKFNRKVSYVSK